MLFFDCEAKRGEKYQNVTVWQLIIIETERETQQKSFLSQGALNNFSVCFINILIKPASDLEKK